MKTRQLLTPLALCCAVATLMGCASTAHQTSEFSVDETNPEGDEALSPTELSQPVILDEAAFRKLDLDTNAAVTLDEWRDFNTNAAVKENLTILDEIEDGQNVTEFSMQATKHPEIYPLFGDAEQINTTHFSWEEQEFAPQGLQLFSIGF